MEADGALTLLRRSVKNLNLIYKIYLGDWDSKSFATVSKAKSYGPLVYTEKEECIAHITKRMGTGLREKMGSCQGMK